VSAVKFSSCEGLSFKNKRLNFNVITFIAPRFVDNGATGTIFQYKTISGLQLKAVRQLFIFRFYIMKHNQQK
jgi:hypothetical protein